MYAFGRNVDGQLGLNSRKESRQPAIVAALKDDVVCEVACGIDFSLAVTESGTEVVQTGIPEKETDFVQNDLFQASSIYLFI